MTFTDTRRVEPGSALLLFAKGWLHPETCGVFPRTDICVVPHHQHSTTTTAIVAQSDRSISSLCVRMDLRSSAIGDALQSGCIVKTTQTAPSVIAITIVLTGDNCHLLLQFPAPISGSRSRTRIARKSLYIEVEAPVDTTAWQRFPSFMSLCTPKEAVTQYSGFHHLDLEILPTLDVGSSW